MDWSRLYGTEVVEERWQSLLEINHERVRHYMGKKGGFRDKFWFNKRYEIPREERDVARNKWRKREKKQDPWAKYKQARSEYIRIPREEEKLGENCN